MGLRGTAVSDVNVNILPSWKESATVIVTCRDQMNIGLRESLLWRFHFVEGEIGIENDRRGCEVIGGVEMPLDNYRERY